MPAATVKDLGVILDPHLTYNEHISKVVSPCFSKLSQINRVKVSFDWKTLYLIPSKNALLLFCMVKYLWHLRDPINPKIHL